MIKRMVLMLILVGLVLGGIFGYKIFGNMMMKKYMASAGAPAQAVSTVKAETLDWQPKLEAVGSVRAINGADLSAEVSGIVQSINFESGGDVEKDTLLVQLRADDDMAKLKALEATARLAAITVDRDLKQLKAQAISRAAYDNDVAALDNAKAQVAQQQAIIDKKTIKAPFAGHLGIRLVDVGQFVNPGTPLVTLQQLDPVYVDFNMPEQAITKIELKQKVTARIQAYTSDSFEGEIIAINSKVDETTRNVQIRASFKNPDKKLLPGMFATLTLETGKPEKYLTLPQTVITYNPYGNTVYLVDNTDPAKPIAKQAFVTTGLTRGDQVAILTGIKEGDEVVSSGQLKIRNGAPIKINNELQPTNDPDPKPKEY